MELFAFAAAQSTYWPFAVLGIAVGFIVLAITVLRLHAFLALILAALLAGWLSTAGRLPGELSQNELQTFEKLWALQPCSADALQQALDADNWTGGTVADELRSMDKTKGVIFAEKSGGETLYRAVITLGAARQQANASHAIRPLTLAAADFGKGAGGIGIVIALASIIGVCLMESGAADKIVRRFVSFFGESRGAIALLVSGFFLSIPVFFDTVFFLLVPLARAMGLRTGRNFMLYVLAIGGGGALTHSIVPPTPGPLLVAEYMNIDLGVSIVVGLVAGILPAIGIYFVCKWLDRNNPVEVREVAGASIADLNSIIAKKDDQLPHFALAIVPVVLPVVLIAAASFLAFAEKTSPNSISPALLRFFDFVGNKTFALLLGAFIAMWIYLRQCKLTLAALGEKLGPSLETAGVIILITSAGGAFGAMIRYAGVGDAIEAASAGRELNYILLAWIVTAVVRVAQGSATVSMITGSALMYAIIEGKDLGYSPVYIYLAIGFGSMILSWMNDSGFWVVGKLSGFTEKETLKTWTVMVSALSLFGLVEILIFAKLFPLTSL